MYVLSVIAISGKPVGDGDQDDVNNVFTPAETDEAMSGTGGKMPMRQCPQY